MNLTFQACAGHTDRVFYTILVVYDKFLRQNMDDLTVHGKSNGLGRIDHPFDILFCYYFVFAADRDNAFAVYAPDMIAGNSGKYILDMASRHQLGLLNGPFDRLDGFIDVDDDTPAQSLGGGGPYPCNAQGIILVYLGHNYGNLGRADIKAYKYLFIIHKLFL
jgi:hypothetical protein